MNAMVGWRKPIAQFPTSSGG